MLVYNHTIKVNWAIADDWLTWEKEINIPQIMSTKLFDDFKIFQLIERDDHDGPTYIIQFFTSSISNYETYVSDHQPEITRKAFEQWGDHFIAHRTVMRLVK